MKVYLVSTKFQKIEIKRKETSSGAFYYVGSKYLDIHIHPPNSSGALTKLSDRVKSGFRKLVKPEDKENDFSNAVRNVKVTFLFIPMNDGRNEVYITLAGALFTFLNEEFEKKLEIKMQMVFASDDLSAPVVINQALTFIPSNGEEICLFSSLSDNAWLIEQLQTKDHIGAMFTVEANIDQVDMSPLLEFRQSLSLQNPGEELTLVLENDGKIRCSKAKLEAISPVISNWLERWQNGEVEEKNVLNLSKTSLSPEAVAAFEKFMLEPNGEKAIKDAVNEPSITFELLQFGDEYIMQPLVDMMKNIFMEKLDQWHMDVALRLYVILRKISIEDLKTKVLQVIKANAEQLKESQVFPTILQNQELATELFVLTMQL